MRRVVLAVAIAVLAVQATAWSGDGSSGAAAKESATKRYHLAVSGMT